MLNPTATPTKSPADAPGDVRSKRKRYTGPKLYRALYILSFLLAMAGTCVAIGALASLQAYCTDNDGIVDGLQPKYRASAAFQAGLQGPDCDNRWRFQWFGIALEITFLTILFVIYKMRKVWKYKSALFALAAFATTLHAIYSNDLLIQAQRTEGNFKTRGSVAFVGFCMMCAGNILVSFVGSALYETHRPGWFRNDPKHHSNNGEAEGPRAGADHVESPYVRAVRDNPAYDYDYAHEPSTGIRDAPADAPPVVDRV